MRKIVDIIEDTTIDLSDSLKTTYIIERYAVSERFINEKYGTYKGQTKLVDEIVKFMLSHNMYSTFEITKDKLDKFENVFFEKLIIHWDAQENSYIPDDSEYLDDKKIFDVVEIYLNVNRTRSYKSLASALLHEMTHAYTNFCMYITNSDKTLGDVIDDEQTNIRLEISQRIKSSNVSDETKEIHKYVDFLCYFLRREEQNAFKSELKAEMMDMDNDKIKLDYKSFLNLIKSCNTYTNCIKLMNFMNQIKQNKDENIRKSFSKLFDKIMQSKDSYSEIYSKYHKRLRQIKRSLEKQAAKIYCEWIETKTKRGIIDRPFDNKKEYSSSLDMNCSGEINECENIDNFLKHFNDNSLDMIFEFI